MFFLKLVLASCAVWILLITETLVLGYKVERKMFDWPMWLAVGASGGYLMSFITLIFSFCRVVCKRRKADKYLTPPREQF